VKYVLHKPYTDDVVPVSVSPTMHLLIYDLLQKMLDEVCMRAHVHVCDSFTMILLSRGGSRIYKGSKSDVKQGIEGGKVIAVRA